MLNTEQLAILATELQDAKYANLLADQEYEAIAALLNDRPIIDNPDPQPSVPRQFTWATFVDLLTVAERLALYSDYGNFAVDLRRALEANDRTELLALWAAIKTVMVPATVTAVEAAFAESVPDDSWPPTILGNSRATGLELPRVRPADVQWVEQQ